MKSTFLKLNLKDLLKGLVVAVLTAVITSLYQAFQDGGMPTAEQFKTAGLIGVGAALSYLLKNLFTDSVAEAKQTLSDATTDNTVVFTNENKKPK